MGQELHFKRPVRPGDAITARVTVRELRADKGIVVLECECTNQFGQTVISGQAEVLAPRERIEWSPRRLPSASLHQGGPDPLDLTGKLARFLVSDAASGITGTVIPVDGGQHLTA